MVHSANGTNEPPGLSSRPSGASAEVQGEMLEVSRPPLWIPDTSVAFRDNVGGAIRISPTAHSFFGSHDHD